MSKKPIIAILTAQTEHKGIPIERVSLGYIKCVSEAGGIPIILPNLHDALENYLPLLDGLLIIGGKSDIHPSLYGESPKGAEHLNLEKDQFEIKLIEGALAKGAPIMGICRGMQMLNVYFGGSLTQDIDDHFDREQFNQHIHKLNVQDSKILEPGTYPVNSIHHQVVNKIAPGMQASALSEDGHVEMIEHTELPVFGVQWHPECLPEDSISKDLFNYFVGTAL